MSDDLFEEFKRDFNSLKNWKLEFGKMQTPCETRK
jgi:hypothetical protein